MSLGLTDYGFSLFSLNEGSGFHGWELHFVSQGEVGLPSQTSFLLPSSKHSSSQVTRSQLDVAVEQISQYKLESFQLFSPPLHFGLIRILWLIQTRSKSSSV